MTSTQLRNNMKHLKKYNESWFSKKENNPELDAIESKIQDAAYSLKSFGTGNKQASFINGAKWAIHNLTDDEIKYMRENTDPEDHSFLGM
jgi:hypothetical protein